MKKMRLHFLSQKRHVVLLLALSLILSFFFVVYKGNVSPPCLNADEAAFGYNAYSLLHTGADEYGNFLPLRLKSFGDYKMPLYSYLSVPFVATFGLNELGTRALNIVIALLFPFAIYFLAKELFKNETVGAIAAVLISVNLGKGIVAREAHEALLAAFLITLASYFFLKFLEKQKYTYATGFVISLFLALFSYQSSRVFALFFFVYALIYFIIKKMKGKTVIFFASLLITALVLFAITDIIYRPTRVTNLFLTSTPGFSMKVRQLLDEEGNNILYKHIFYNKVTVGAREVLSHYLQYFSPQFLAEDGDTNVRFGFLEMSPMTPLAYFFIFFGIYFLFRKKERWRYYLLLLIAISPVSAALSWQDTSLTRSFFILFPLLILSAYGAYSFFASFAGKKIFLYLIIGGILLEAFLLYYPWDFYLNHYPKRPLVTQSWQCGYEPLASFVKKNYNNYNTFYITQKHGAPYIFMLFYLQYPPQKYQKQASLTDPDQYGFGQVDKFDKFNFSVPGNAAEQHNVVIAGYPDDFNQFPNIDKSKIKKIIINNIDVFWIYATK